MESSKIFVTSHPRIGPVLAEEMKKLDFNVKESISTGVRASGNFVDAIRMNLYLRTANRVLLELVEFNAEKPTELYEQAIEYPWEEVLKSDGYYSVQSNVRTEAITDNRFANLKLKDAIADRIKSKTGQRPNSGPLFDRSVIFLHWHENKVQIYYDTSGETIARRGYRKNPFKAPMNEALAAASVLSTNWDRSSPFVNPMCGSGTVAIEAALISMNKAPGIARHNFSFMHHCQYNSTTYRMLRNEAIVKELRKPKARILATDISPVAINATKENARSAELIKFLDFRTCDFRETEIPEGEGVVFLNPEYGQRLGEENRLKKTYEGIGDFFKQQCSGYTGYVFSGNANLAKSIGLKTTRKIEFYNGKIDSRLLEFGIYKGSQKPKNEPS